MEVNAARASVQIKPEEEKPVKKVAKEEVPEVKEEVKVEKNSTNKIDLTA